MSILALSYVFSLMIFTQEFYIENAYSSFFWVFSTDKTCRYAVIHV